MKKLIRVPALICALILLLSLAVYADDPWSEEYYRIIDYTNTLTDEEMDSLDADCIEILREYRVDLAVLAVGAEDLGEGLVAFEDTEKHKPDPDPVLAGMERLGSTPETTLVVGDSAYDILCAHNAGVKAALVTWSEAAAAGGFEGAAAPDYTVSGADALSALILE